MIILNDVMHRKGSEPLSVHNIV